MDVIDYDYYIYYIFIISLNDPTIYTVGELLLDFR